MTMMDSFKDSKVLQKANLLKKENLYPFFRAIEDSNGTNVIVNGNEQIMIGSNNYLGLTHHPYVIEETKKAIDKFGTGCTGSRFLNGNLIIHEELEEKLARYIGHEKSLVFSTGMQTNLGVLSAICGPKDCMIFDSENHASIIDASRLAMGPTFKYKHNDMENLEQILIDTQDKYNNIIIVADGVFSMTGELMALPEVVELSKKYNTFIYVDDAHGLGVMGNQGRGTMDHFNVTSDVHFNMGTFSKSFASIGGFISGPATAIDYIKHSARSFMFSASMPPSAVATVSACIDLVTKQGNKIHDNLWDNVSFMKKGFKEIGFYTYKTETPIIPIFIGDDIKAMQVTCFLEEMGIFATPVISPAVPAKEALIRTSYMSTHNKNELSKVLEVFEMAKKKFEIPSNIQ